MPSRDPVPYAEPGAEPGAEPNAEPDTEYLRLRDKAYRLLARREHSAWELRRKLQQKMPHKPQQARPPNAHPQLVGRLLAELAEQGAQSDARFTEQHCRRRYQGGRGPVKLRYELAQHRIEEAIIERVMTGYEPRWRALAAEVRRKKFGASPASYRDWARQARFLQQRGFTTEQIEPYAGSD